MGAKMVNVDYHEHSKKTKAKARKVKLQTAAAKKAVRQHDKKLEEAVPLFPAIQVLAIQRLVCCSLLFEYIVLFV